MIKYYDQMQLEEKNGFFILSCFFWLCMVPDRIQHNGDNLAWQQKAEAKTSHSICTQEEKESTESASML